MNVTVSEEMSDCLWKVVANKGLQCLWQIFVHHFQSFEYKNGKGKIYHDVWYENKHC